MKKCIGMFLFAMGILMMGCGKEEVKLSQVIVSEETTEATETAKPSETTEMLQFADLKDVEFYFASGAGGWRTVLQIESDGSFSGIFSDSEMGSVGEGYPNGTYYYCDFEGIFTEPVKVNDYTYSMKIQEISCANQPETTEIRDEILYCYSTPYGIEGAEEVLLYLPGAPTKELPEEYMSWVRNDMENPDTPELPFYGLYNQTEQNGFSSYDISGRIDDMMDATKEWSSTIRASLEHEDLNQAEMNEKAQELYEIWDSALNTLWSELKEELSEDEFAKLLAEQRAWIAKKEGAVEEAGKEYEGGSIYGLIVSMEAADITEERVYELYEMLK